ncbi:MAG: Wadjet anti-phage system protein JetD domain-containing protein [Desulfococcaceae bacterium]
MISPEEIREKAEKYWDNGRFLKADLAGGPVAELGGDPAARQMDDPAGDPAGDRMDRGAEEPFFPLRIPFRTPNAKEQLEDFAAVRRWAKTLWEGSKDVAGFGYRLETRTVNHRRLGNQELPDRIVFETREDFLRFIGKTGEYRKLVAEFRRIVAAQPGLAEWLMERPLTVLKYAGEWDSLLAVCLFFQEHPLPDRYLRELDVPGVDTKFIEGRKPVLRDMLDRVLPPGSIRAEEAGEGRYGFERRFGLRHDLPLIRFRLLDPALRDGTGLTDISVPVAEFRELDLPCRHVFVTENKINGLSFPEVPGGIVIFGLGYGVHGLKEVPWLRDRNVVYWGDIDTHGFAMLSMIRGFLPHTRAFLMDEETLLAFEPLWGEEPKQTRTEAELPNLTAEERALYEKLLNHAWAENLRLEQERIGFAWVRRGLGVVLEGLEGETPRRFA